MEEAGQPPVTAARGSLLSALPDELTAGSAVAILFAMAMVSTLVRISLGAEVHGPFVFMDEPVYARMAQSLAHTGRLSLFGKSGLTYSPLYSVVLAPAYALTTSAHSAYEAAKAVNAVLMSLSVFPLYGIARFVLPRLRALGVAALALLAPLMFYSGLEMSENLAYPLFLVAVLAMLRSFQEPSVRNDALLVGAIALAATARLELVVLFPTALTALLLVALLPPAPPRQRLRSLLHAVRAHRLLVVLFGVGLADVVFRTVSSGGALPLAGNYAKVGGARPSPLHVVTLAVQHVAELDLAVGLVPFACALLAAYALVRRGFPHRALIFASVTVAAAAWLVLEVAYFAAAYDHVHSISPLAPVPNDIARIHERYLIYLVPLLLVAMVAGLREARPRVRTSAHVAIALVATLLPLAVPFAHVVNDTIVVDTFGLQIFGSNVGGTIVPIGPARLVAFMIGAVLALAYLYALVRPRPSFAVVMTVIAFAITSSLVRARILTAATGITSPVLPAHADWVDRATGGGAAALVGDPHANRAGLVATLADNLTVARLYSLCTLGFGADFGDSLVTVARDGTLRDASRPVRARYAVVPARLGLRGRILARDAKAGLVLVAPSGGLLSVAGRHRAGCRS